MTGLGEGHTDTVWLGELDWVTEGLEVGVAGFVVARALRVTVVVVHTVALTEVLWEGETDADTDEVKDKAPETVMDAEPERVTEELGAPVKDMVDVANEDDEGGCEIVLLPQKLTRPLGVLSVDCEGEAISLGVAEEQNEGVPVGLEVSHTVRVPLTERDTEVDKVAVLEKEALEEAVRVLH